MPTIPVVVMGVAGAGKTTLGRALADGLDVPYVDADDLHPATNITKMASGRPLGDHDRWPWLARVRDWLACRPDGGVVSCSALKRSYRDFLRDDVRGLFFAHLDADPTLIAHRLAERAGHFMPQGLLASQFAALEPLADDEPGLVVDAEQPVDVQVDRIVRALFRVPPGGPAPSEKET